MSPVLPRVAVPLRRALAGLARGAPARVFVVEGLRPPVAIEALRTCDGVQLVDSPRSATVLLVAGWLPGSLMEPAWRTHDAVAHPRATVCWTRADVAGTSWVRFPHALVIAETDSDAGTLLSRLGTTLQALQASLLRGAHASEGALLPDVDPAPWRGIGPYGHGGAGMTGGVPYGRPLTGRAPDRDRLELDQLPLRVGPFFAPFPTGLVLDVKLQGDLVQEAVVPGNAFAGAGVPATRGDDVFEAALTRPVPLAALERARARHHLLWLAKALRVHGLGALGRRAASLAMSLERAPTSVAAEDVIALARLLARGRALDWATSGVGGVAADAVAGQHLGLVARAAGVEEDVRLADAGYRRVGFDPGGPEAHAIGVSTAGDARARWRWRVAEAAHSVAIAGRAGGAMTGGDGVPVEGPRGTLRDADGAMRPPASVALLALLPTLLRNLEWGDAVTTVVSLDIDVREGATGATPLAPAPAPPATPAPDEHAGHGASMSGMRHEGAA